MRRIGLLLGLLSWSALGCGDGGGGTGDGVTGGAVTGDHGWQLALRLIPEEPLATFERQRLYEEVRVFDWTFESEADMAGWRWNRFDRTPRRVDEGILVERGSEIPELVRKVDLDAMSIDTVEVDVGGLYRGPLRWFWTRQGENFVTERGLWVKGSDEAGAAIVTQRLQVSSHPEWSGRIRRLRLDPTMAAGEVVRLQAVRGVRYQAPDGFLDAAVRLPWKVDLDHEQRNAWLAPPGQPIERRIVVPKGARLHFAYGVEGRASGAVRFDVVAKPARREPLTLFTAVLDPTTDDSARWHDGSADLAAFEGQQLELTFETSVVGGWGASSAMPVWGNPEILLPSSAAPRPNVILISVDTLRPDHLSLYGYGRDTSPELATWARQSAIVFENAVASAPWTLPSHVSMLSGLDADRHGVNHRLPMPAEIRSLPEVLRAAGYRTLAITGGGWMHPRYGFGQGFDRYRYWPPKTAKDDELRLGVARAVEWLEEPPTEPFFLFLHTFEAHSPHRRREPFYTALGGAGETADSRAVVTERSSAPSATGYLVSKTFLWHHEGEGLSTVARDDLQEVVDRYDSGVAHADAQLGRLLQRLQELALAESTLVVVTSDHGEAFGEKGLDSHGYLYDFNLLIPLIMALPQGRDAGRRVPEQVRAIDLMPTVLDVVGLPPPPAGEVDGLSLLPLLTAGEAVDREAWSYAPSSNRGLSLRRSGRVKYIFNNTAWDPLRGREELYDLSSDPAELEDLATTAAHLPAIRSRALERLERLATGIEVRVRNGEDSPLSAVVRGSAIRGFQLKMLDIVGASATWDESRSGEAKITVPAGGYGAFLIENALREELAVEVGISSGDTGARFRGVVEAQQERPWEIRYEVSGWAVHRQADTVAATAVTIVRRGAVPSSSVADPAAVDPQLRAQLEALGYLD